MREHQYISIDENDIGFGGAQDAGKEYGDEEIV